MSAKVLGDILKQRGNISVYHRKKEKALGKKLKRDFPVFNVRFCGVKAGLHSDISISISIR